MKLYTIILSLILGTSLQTYAMQEHQEKQTQYSIRDLLPAIAPHVTRKVIKNAIESCIQETDAIEYDYAACIISSKGRKKIAPTKDIDTIISEFNQELSTGEVGFIIDLKTKQCRIDMSTKDAEDLEKYFTQQSYCIDFICSLAKLNVPKGATVTLDRKETEEAFNALPSHMQANLKSYYPWLGRALGSPTESHHIKQPIIQQPSSNSYKKWALWAAIPVVAIASYIAYTYFFK